MIGGHASPSRSGSLAAWFWTTLAAVLLLTLAAEGPHYLSRVRGAEPLGVLDRLVLLGLIARKSAWLLLPGLVVALLLVYFRFVRAARFVWLGSTSIITTWLLVDVLNQRIFGNHVIDWFALIADIDESPSPRLLLAFAGDLTKPIAVALLVFLLLALLMDRLCRHLEVQRATDVRSWLLAGAAILGVALGPPSMTTTDRDGAVRRLLLEMPWIPPGSMSTHRPSDPHASSLESELNVRWKALRPRFDRLPAETGPTRRLGDEPLPDILLVVGESLRPDSLPEDLRQRFEAWRPALELSAHGAGTNASHFALFEILHGRSSLGYDALLDLRRPPTMLALLDRLGYQTVLASSVDNHGFRRMHEYLSGSHFDVEIALPREYKLFPRRDVAVLERTRELLAPGDRPPRFILVYLMSTHYPFVYPKEYSALDPQAGVNFWVPDWERQFDKELLRRRYAVACRFLYTEILRTVATIDPSRTLFLLVGDHGESFGEDGALLHPTRPSRTQSRTLARLAGAAITPGRVDRTTVHADLLATLAGAIGALDPALTGGSSRDLLRPLLETEPPYFIVAFGGIGSTSVVLVEGDRRLALELSFDPPRIVLRGEVDAEGRALVSSRSPAPDHDWVTAFERAVIAASG